MNPQDKNEFEMLLSHVRIPVERYIHFRMPSAHDAEDVIQETYLGAFQSFENLKNKEFFKTWMLSIAKNQCNLWFRAHERAETVPLETVEESLIAPPLALDDTASSILQRMPRDAAQLLYDHANGLHHTEIADKLQIPVGTVKSRLHYAKKQFRSYCPPELLSYYERGIKMKNEMIMNFPKTMPALQIVKTDTPFFEVKFEEDCFIIPRLGNKNAEGSYRFGELALVSTCTVRKNARIHEAECVQICRDTYNVKRKKLYKNECVWFAQLTEEYLRTLATLRFDDEEENLDIPTEIHTFLEEDFDILVNGNDRVRGLPLLIKENPAEIDENGIHLPEKYIRYTMGVHHVTIGEKVFEAIKFVMLQNGIYTEQFVTKDGKLLLMRWYQAKSEVEIYEFYSDEMRHRLQSNPSVYVNGKEFLLIEDRIGEYAI